MGDLAFGWPPSRRPHFINQHVQCEGEGDLCVCRFAMKPPAANPGYLLYFNNIINERLSGEWRVSSGAAFDLC